MPKLISYSSLSFGLLGMLPIMASGELKIPTVAMLKCSEQPFALSFAMKDIPLENYGWPRGTKICFEDPKAIVPSEPLHEFEDSHDEHTEHRDENEEELIERAEEEEIDEEEKKKKRSVHVDSDSDD